MSLHNGLDIVAIASLGVYSETYGAGEESNIANLYASWGFLEDAPVQAAIERIKLFMMGLFK